jgi:hypothetical protein
MNDPKLGTDKPAICNQVSELQVNALVDQLRRLHADGAIKDMHDASFYAHLIVGFGATYAGTTVPLIGQQSGSP